MMKKAFPILSASALLLSGGTPIFAAEEDTPTGEVETPVEGEETKDPTEGEGEETPTVDEELIASANEMLAALQNVPTQDMAEDQVNALNSVIEDLTAAIEAQDIDAINGAMTDGQAILDALNAKTPEEDNTALIEQAQAVLDKSAQAIAQYSEQWSAEDTQNIKDLCTQLQAAITGGNAEEIQTAYENLQTAIEGLKKDEPVDPEPTPDSVNKDALWALLEKYDGYVSTDYTADSWAAFYSAYETASAVAQNDDATQDEVDAAVAALERAGAALVPASGSEKPDGSPDNEYNQTEKPADTSASMPIAPYACVTLLAAGAAFVAIRKKRTAK